MKEEWMVIIIGLLLIGIGIGNRMGNISTIHWYQRTKVKKEDEKAYGKAMGNGTILIGAALTIGGGMLWLSWNGWEPVLSIGAILGIGWMLYGQLKYNHGIF